MSANSMSHSRPMLGATARSRFGIQGFVSPGFEPVQEVFTENFVRRGEAGGACCAFHNGEKIADLWGGMRNKQIREPWEKDTMVIVYFLQPKVWQQ